MQNYRAEVDGLRALAVFPVILFHAGVTQLPGGFLGVDVFFVISGYLISRIILEDLESQKFSLLSFYERRARRILPALFVVMAITFPLSWWLAPPEIFAGYLASLRATALFFSNVHFWQSLNYFNPSAGEQPLLHTWSLGVEEQFYILFPLLLWFVWRFARRFLLPVFLGLLLLGFATCLFQFSKSRDAAFFLLHARAWELFAGVLVMLLERGAFSESLKAGWIGKALATVGLAAIAVGFFAVTEASDAPGWPSLWPVIGTMLVLLFATGNGFAGRLLTGRPVVALGLISYSAYLWHHPLFAFARLYSVDEPRRLVMLALVVLALVLATLTYFLVEKPFRSRKLVSRCVVFALAPLSIAALVVLGSLGLTSNWAEARFNPVVLARVLPPLYKTEGCAWTTPIPDAQDIRFCPLGVAGSAHPVILWGDSHAQAIVGELDRALRMRGQSGFYINTSRCLRIAGVYELSSHIDRNAADCAIKQERVFEALAALQPQVVVVHMRWTMRLFPLPGAGSTPGFDNREGGVEVEQPRQLVAKDNTGAWSVGEEGKAKALTTFFNRLEALAPLVVVGPVPEVGWHVGNRNFKTSVLRHAEPPDISTSFALFQERNGAVHRMLDAAAKVTSFTRIEPSKLLCDTLLPGRCVAQQAGSTYYSDDDHVSETGAHMIVSEIIKALPTVPAAQP